MPLPTYSDMTNKELFYFVGKCLTLDEHPEFRDEIIQRISSDLINWPDFVFLCSNHLVLPAIYLKFSAYNIIVYLPDELVEFLTEIYQLNLSRNEQILKQINEISNLLNKNEIYPTYLKGAGNLLDKLYCDTGERIMGDIDLLVSEKDYLRAVKIVENDGYSTISEKHSDIQNLKHYPRLSKEYFPAVLEIHRIPVSSKYTAMYNTTIIDSEKIAIISNDLSFVLSDNHKAIHNFIHAQLSNKEDFSGIISFRDMYDLYLISKRISIAQTMVNIQYKRQAIAYFIFTGRALGLPKWFYQTEPIYARFFCVKHNLLLDSPAFYRLNQILKFLGDRFFTLYLGQLFKSLYSKSMRRSLAARLSNPRWYLQHIDLYIRFFSQKNS
jgi:hypothetical protein